MNRRYGFAIVAIACLTAARAAGDDAPSVIFNPKTFYDSGDVVHVEGTLAGEGVGYKNNRSAVTCYRDRRECLMVHIEAEGRQVFSIGPPVSFAVRLWAADRILAGFASPCGAPPSERLKGEWQTTTSDTWVIDRARQTAELIDHPCLGAKTYHWTIEEPPFWKDAEKRAGEAKPGP